MRGSYKAVENKNMDIVKRIRHIKSHHPFWGYRRVWAHLKYVDGLNVNQKRIYRLMRVHHLLVDKNTKLKAKRTPQTVKPKPDKPNQWWGIDMTKVKCDGFGWVYIVIVIDWYTKKIVGYEAGLQSKAWHWLKALNKAVNKQFQDGARENNLHLMSDNGCQPTSTSFMRDCSILNISQAFTSYNNPKGNADTERFMRTMKEELFWINEFQSPNQIYKALDKWIDQYNSQYLHSTLGYKTPMKFEEEYNIKNNSNPPLIYAC